LKRRLSYLVVLLVLLISAINVVAQAPSISYSPSTNALLNGLPFSISPINSGGAVPATVYGTITTFVGSAAGAGGRANGTGTGATFNLPRSIAIDLAGNHYISDAGNNEIRLATSAGVVTLLAGNAAGTAGMANGTGTGASFNLPYDLTTDPSGNLYIADYNNNQIRKITIATGAVTLLAGNAGGGTGSANGTGTAASFNGPVGIVYNPVDGFLYVSDYANNLIRKVSLAGVVTTFAGSGTAGTTNATGTAARFDGPNGIGVDATGNMYVGDQNNNEVRKIIRATAVVSLFAGSTAGTAGTTDGTTTGARFNTPRGITVDASGNLYVTDSGNNTVRLITPAGLVSTFAGGAGTAGYTNAVGTAARFDQPRGLDFDPATGNLYVADYNNNAIRQIITTGYYISAPLPAGLAFDNTTGIISGTPTANFGATLYTVFAFNATGSSSTTITLSCTTPTTVTRWRGTTNTTWTTASNWSNGAPTTTASIEIGTVAYTGLKLQPTISANATIQSIEFGTLNTPTLTINSGITLTVNSGMGVDASSNATIKGPGTISLDGSSYIVPGGSITVALNGIVKLAATAQLVNSGTFTLASDASGSASIGAIPLTSSITGTFAVQRYVSGGSNTYRGYRLMSSPVYAAQVSGNNVYSLDYIKTSALITGTNGSTDGFDKAGNPTIYLFREDQAVSNTTFTSGNYFGLSKMNNAPSYNFYFNNVATLRQITAGNGFLFFFRGDRTTNLINKYTTTTSAESVTFSSSGTLNTGTIVVKDWYLASGLGYSSTAGNAAVKGFNLVGNPYPSSIDWDTFGTSITGANLSNTMYILDPVSKNYRSYTKGNGGVASDGTTSANVIPSGQGFFVLATAANPTLTFTEAAKTASQVPNINLYLGTPADNVVNKQNLHLQLAKDEINTDGIQISFNNNHINDQPYDYKVDAPYKVGYGAVSLSSRSSDNVDLSTHTVSLPGQGKAIIALNVSAKDDAIYKLTLKDITGIPQLYDIWLMDAYKRDSMDMRQNKTYSFNIYKKDTLSFGPKRFTLVVRQNPAYAYHLLDFTANKLPTARQVQIVWKTENEENYTHFTVERSIDQGKTFDVLGSAKAAGQGTYSLLDKTPVVGQNLYRLKQEDINSTISYSKPVTVLYANLSNQTIANNLSIYPNPVINTVNLDILSKTTENSSYRIRFMSSAGVIVKQVISSQPSWQGSISNLQPGIYLIRVFNNKNDAFVGETKFVKL